MEICLLYPSSQESTRCDASKMTHYCCRVQGQDVPTRATTISTTHKVLLPRLRPHGVVVGTHTKAQTLEWSMVIAWEAVPSPRLHQLLQPGARLPFRPTTRPPLPVPRGAPRPPGTPVTSAPSTTTPHRQVVWPLSEIPCLKSDASRVIEKT
jgi:hypothetical protein